MIVKKLKTYGNSMLPFLHNGDVLNISPVSFPSIRVDDIITVKKNSYFFTHRVVYKSPKGTKTKYLITKGDNNYRNDGKIHPDDIVGKVQSLERAGKKIDFEHIYLFQSTTYFQALQDITATFVQKKIVYIILKGLPLHLYYEKTIPRRFYYDCDLLVSPNQFEEAQTTLRFLGYEKATPDLSTGHKILKREEKEITFIKKFHNNIIVSIDLHQEAVSLMDQIDSTNAFYSEKLLRKFSLALLTKVQKIKLQNTIFPIPQRQLLVCYLAFHLFHHNMRGYFRYELIDSILRNHPEDKKALVQIIKEYQLESFVYPVFFLLSKNYNNQIAKKILKNIVPDPQKIDYIKKKLVTQDIYTSEWRVNAGIERFLNLFFLSPRSFLMRISIFLQPQVVYSLMWVGAKEMKKYLRKIFGNKNISLY